MCRNSMFCAGGEILALFLDWVGAGVSSPFTPKIAEKRRKNCPQFTSSD